MQLSSERRSEMRNCPSRRGVLAGLLPVLAALAVLSPAVAQFHPSGTIRIVAAAAAGTPPDIVSRLVANELSRAEGWRVIVENKPGAMQSLGQAEVLRQPADGHTLVSVSLPGVVAPALMRGVKFRLDTDFAPVIKLATAYHVLVVHPSVSPRSLPELVALLKREPDKLTFSSGGFGTPAHLAGELFKLKTGVRATHVPYQALPRAIADLLNGTNQFQFITPLPVLELVADGRLRALAVTAPARMPALPDIPTVGEAGLPDMIMQDWMGLLVKSGTRNDAVVRLNAAISNALAAATVRAALAKMAAEPAGGSPEDFGRFVSAQVAYWGKVVKDAGIEMQQ